MSHADNLNQIRSILDNAYNIEKTRIVPKRSDLTFGNTIKKIEHAVVLYIDMRNSRKIIHDQGNEFWGVKTHRAFLQSIVGAVESQSGHFRSFNGDGALAFFVGEHAAARAVKAGMLLTGYVYRVNDMLKSKNKKGFDYGAGIGQGEVLTAKSGKKGEDSTKQDLVWVGIPTYVAVELSGYGRSPKSLWISHKVYNAINKDGNYLYTVSSDGANKWTKTNKNLRSVGSYDIYYTSWYFEV